ncbi:MAG: penicillin-binding protein 2 [Patescibacteria group bacterium]
MKKPTFFVVEDIGLGRKSSFDWVEGSCDLGQNKKVRADFLSLALSDKKIKIFIALMFIGLAVLLAKSFYLQTIKGNYYYSMAENNRIKVSYIPAHRGIIYDRLGKPLVQNVSGFSLFIVPTDLPREDSKRQEVLSFVSQSIGVPLGEIGAKLHDAEKYYFQPVAIKTGISYDQAMALKIMSSDMPGVILDVDFWRKYLYGESFSHLLGYVGKISAPEYEKNNATYLLSDNMGKAGLEKYYERCLKGQHGQERIEVDALGHEKKIISQAHARPGDSLLLSVDADLQNKIYEILKENIKGGRGSVVVSNPQNGDILAMVDYPSYDNNSFAQGIDVATYKKLLEDPNKPLFARSIQGEYPSGSTVKPVIAVGALQEKIVTENTTVNSVGGLRVGKWLFPDWKAGGHGVTNVIKAIAMSVNTYFYYIGGGYGDFNGLGIDLLDKYFRLFGLGETTGIDLLGERSGFVPTPEWKEGAQKVPWYIGDTYHVSIGQGDLLVTPLQVNNYTSAIANGGKLFVPHLAVGVVHADGQKELFPIKTIRTDMVDDKNIKIVQRAMRETVISGSARSLSSVSVEVAGKTGTAQWNTTKKNHAWFIGFAPYNNPTFCITVLFEEGGEGSSVSVPIAHEIMDYWFARK